MRDVVTAVPSVLGSRRELGYYRSVWRGTLLSAEGE